MEQMSRNEAVQAVLDLYDKIAFQEETIKSLNAIIDDLKKSSKPLSKIDETQKHLIEEGKRAVLNETLYTWCQCSAERKNGKIVTTDFKTWFDRKVSKLPDWCSQIQFNGIFNRELYDLYEDDKKHAIDRLKEEEKKAQEKERGSENEN